MDLIDQSIVDRQDSPSKAESTQDDSVKFIDEPFQVVDQPVAVADMPIGAEEPVTEPTAETDQPTQTNIDFSIEDLAFISESLINLPTMIWDKLPQRKPEQIESFNKAFFRYCQKKNINPFDYLFEEFEILIIVLGIVGSYRRDHKEFYGKEKETKDTDKLNIDHSHYQDVNEGLN